MILASLILTLKIENQASLPMSHGRLLHAAFLDLVHQQSPDLSQRMHDSLHLNFSVGLLRIRDIQPDHGNYHFRAGDKVSWRITTLDDELIAAVSRIKPGQRIRIGSIAASILRIVSKPEDHKEAFITNTDNLLEAAKEHIDTFRILMHFNSPVSFRYYDTYYPSPRPDLVFGSIADKWNNIVGDPYIDTDAFKQIALAHLIPDNWQGETRRVNITRDRSLTAFEGNIAFNISSLPKEYREIFVALAEFSAFSGVGAYTGQGMGQVRVELRGFKK